MGSRSSLSSMLFISNCDEQDHVNKVMSIQQDTHVVPSTQPRTIPPNKRRNTLDSDVEVIAPSPSTIITRNRYVCEVCQKGFLREQNLQLHKRGHNLPWKLKLKSVKDLVKRKAYVCPEPSCINHDPSHALGDLTAIKKHYLRRHGEKKYKCQKCSNMYAVKSDLKAHSKNCGMKEFQCICGSIFSRRDSFVTHRAFCEALGQGVIMRQPPTFGGKGVGSFKSTSNNNENGQMSVSLPQMSSQTHPAIAPGVSQFNCYKPSAAFFMPSSDQENKHNYQERFDKTIFTNLVNNTTTTKHNHMEAYNLNLLVNHENYGAVPQLSSTALLEKAALLGSMSGNNSSTNFIRGYASSSSSSAFGAMNTKKDGLGFGSSEHFGNSDSNGCDSNMNRELLNTFSSGGASYKQEDHYHGGLDNGSRGYHDGWKSFNIEEQLPPQNAGANVSFQRSTGVTFTRDFLGVGEETVGNFSSEELDNTFGGRSFL